MPRLKHIKTGVLNVGYAEAVPANGPAVVLQWWYQFYFATERGRLGYEQHRRDFNRLIWQLVSPNWNFDDATFNRTAAAFDNPDHVAIVIHNYRCLIGLPEGKPQYDELEQRLAKGPAVTVPTLTLEGDANGVPHPDASAYAKKFSGKYEHRTIAVPGHEKRPGHLAGPGAFSAKPMGATTVKIDSSHVAMVSHPGFVTDFVIRASEAVTD